jgi:hypothetical protein
LSHNRAEIAREVLERDRLWLLASSIAREVLERDRLWLLASSIALTGSVDRLSNNLHKFADIILNILAIK